MVSRSINVSAWIGASLLASAVAAGTPSTEPSTQSAEIRLPESFAIFETVNPFSAKHHPASVDGVSEKGGPEASIVLDGVAQTGNGWTAFFDSGKGNPVLTLSVGDPIARGRIQSVDLDSIVYVRDEQPQQVEVGQNLNGATRPPSSQPATPETDHKPGRPSRGQPPNGQPPNGQPSNGLAFPPDAQPPNAQPPTENN